jgi:hypothetical protein
MRAFQLSESESEPEDVDPLEDPDADSDNVGLSIAESNTRGAVRDSAGGE